MIRRTVPESTEARSLAMMIMTLVMLEMPIDADQYRAVLVLAVFRIRKGDGHRVGWQSRCLFEADPVFLAVGQGLIFAP